MNEELLKSNICKVTCGTEEGTGFLVNDNIILTAYHICSDNSQIFVQFDTTGPIKATLHKIMDDVLKELDVAVLVLTNSRSIEHFNIVDRSLSLGEHWITRGFPGYRNLTGTNLIDVDNHVVQQLNSLEASKIDVHLNLPSKVESYEGLSGAPLIIDENIVGIINTELLVNGAAKELNALSVKYFKKTLDGLNVPVLTGEQIANNNQHDTIAACQWPRIIPEDKRNISEKISAVYPDAFSPRINQYNRLVSIGKTELSEYEDRDISAIKYRVFEACQDKLIEYCEANQRVPLKDFIEHYVSRAKFIIEDMSKTKSYPTINDDLVMKIVLDLIDECYLAFDEDGIYE